MDLIDELADLSDDERRRIIQRLGQAQRTAIIKAAEYRHNNPWMQYKGEPVRYMEEGLGEASWSLQREILESCVTNKRTAVPTTHGIGKALANGTPVLTPTGWTPIEELRPGDQVIGEDGKPAKVTGVYPQGVRKLWRVHFNDGTTIDADGEHLWATTARVNKNRGQRVIRTTDDIRATVKPGWDRVRIPTVAPVEFPHQPVPLDPYVLGLLLGDGGTTQPTPRFSTADPELLEAIQETGIRTRRLSRYDHSLLGISEETRNAGACGRSETKSIHRAYMWNDAANRLAVLQGLMDTDGTVSLTGACEFNSSSPSLVQDMVQLARSLGGTPRAIRFKNTTHQRTYRVQIITPFNPFRLSRKAALWEEANRLRTTTRDRLITGITDSGHGEATCISVDNNTHTYVTKNFIVTHNTHIAARAASYFINVHPTGSAFVLTTSMDFNKVKNILWPHIRTLHKQHNMVGRTTETTWVDGEHKLALGVKPPDQAEAGISGFHKNHMLIIVDEAGGIKQAFGKSLEALMTGIDVHILVMGNPPVHGDTTWFEDICSSPLWNVIPIPYTKTPNFTGEETPVCTACAPEDREDGHRVAQHLTDREWVDDLRSSFGEDSAWFQARAMARFVHDTTSKTLPMDWLDAATLNPDAGPGRISLGIDIAADGGDEFVIARKDGWTCKIVHKSSGADNGSVAKVKAVILTHIRDAVADHKARGILEPVRVKLDSIGIGWGVAGDLQQWEDEGLFRDGPYDAHIVPVNVSENANDTLKYHRSRDEMWWNLRTLIEPMAPEQTLVRLELENITLAQLNGPTYEADSNARILVENKEHLRKRGLRSPDQGEAVLLAFYEPASDNAGPLTFLSYTKRNTFS